MNLYLNRHSYKSGALAEGDNWIVMVTGVLGPCDASWLEQADEYDAAQVLQHEM